MVSSHQLPRELPFIQKIFRVVNDAFFTLIEKEHGSEYIANHYDILDHYIFTMIHIFLHTVISGDESLFALFIADMMRIKQQLNF